ncbi:Homeodomain-like DNA binding domain-containing transcription factor [Phycomyces blakesleeanus NRRL 1555(-)]|uniref:Homeodomain-like DNA binding domain-containing transcription factor n=1 Tax=Phycomyces blakesleeanus (strain ATCC 8743b / DSM 1359 / FGSC 10004 / NBRC 33097 / NRRL 1555) TaxID=763407 RepID=A0A162U6Z2_PHYB8|nr:Homeodomain-like DNA binding domain-containing transcription factor [Phycomyces blakesleeanus NRRL 1555(-)]OAD73962.1 Homeodomain-like DNA binding domain-containing transcription factor [Phycomyces blakesleeanus NRRL 1555(-)]|eukprot:XP_018292002.1 Homeodomain-like DNA binding domain-containing transcription factor [Phycomyces blakesleeanus NRRL 1555(-)]
MIELKKDATVEPKKQNSLHVESLKITDEHLKFIQDLLDKCCTLMLGQMREELFRKYPELQDQNLSISGLHKHIINNIGFTLKRTKPVEEKRNDSKTIELRKVCVDSMHTNGLLYKTNCIFVNKAGFNANLIREQGWSKKDKASIVKTKLKKVLNISIFAGISYQGFESVWAKLTPDDIT